MSIIPDYEKNYDNNMINFRLVGIIGLCLCLMLVMVYPLITSAKQPIIAQNITPEITSTAIQIEYVNVYVTPEPDGKIYFSNEYEQGTRKLKRPFSFYANEAQGLKNLKVTTIVYDYKIFNSLHWRNPSDNKIYEFLPSTNDSKYIFVMINMESDDISADDTRFYMPNDDNYILQNTKTGDVYYNKIFPEELSFTELKDTYNYNDVERVKAFGQEWQYSSNIENKNTAGEVSIKHEVLRGGKSNSEDGYKLYEIKKGDDVEDLIFGIGFYSWGNAWWKLKV